MAHILEFEKLIDYDSGKVGIPVDVELRLGNDSVTFQAKIDTGATFCIFARIQGELLGLTIENGLSEKIRTANGSFVAFGHQVSMITEDFEFDSFVFFAQEDSFTKNVLGRIGWLDRVTIGLNDYEGKLYLSPNKYE